ERVRPAQEPVQGGGVGDVVAEAVSPGGQAAVGGDRRRVVFLVAVVDDVEEGAGPFPSRRQETHVVDDQDGGGGVGAEFGCPGALDAGSGEVDDHVVGGGEVAPVAGLDGLGGQRHRQVG